MQIEKSSDGVQFVNVGQLSVNGSGHYNFNDYIHEGKTYYRIKALLGNHVAYSAVQTVTDATITGVMRISTHVKNMVQLELPAGDEGMYTAQLLNMNGQLVHYSKQNLLGWCCIPLNRSGMRSGLYILKLTRANGYTISRKIVLE